MQQTNMEVQQQQQWEPKLTIVVVINKACSKQVFRACPGQYNKLHTPCETDRGEQWLVHTAVKEKRKDEGLSCGTEL